MGRNKLCLLCLMASKFIKTLKEIGLSYYFSDNGILCSRTKEGAPTMAVLMDLESVMLSETSHEVKEKYHMIAPISGT